MTPEDLKPFKMFAWVLSADQIATYKVWAQSLAKRYHQKMLTEGVVCESALAVG